MTDFNDRFLRLLRAIAAQQASAWTLDALALDVLDAEGMLGLALCAGAKTQADSEEWSRKRFAALKLRDQLHAKVLDRLAALNAQLPEPLLVFKGEALARSIYPDSACRQRQDLDLLLPEAALEASLRLFQEAGFRVHTALVSRYARFEVVLDAGLPVPVGLDLHIRPFFRPWRWQQRSYERLLEDATPLPAWPQLRAPGPADALVLACLHLDKNPHQRAVWWYDLHLLLQVPGVLEQALSLPLAEEERALVRHLCTLADAIFLGSEPSIQLPPRPMLSRWQAWRRDLAALPGTAARARFLAELIGFGVRRA